MKKQQISTKIVLVTALLFLAALSSYAQTGFPLHSSSSAFNFGSDSLKTTGTILTNKMGIGTTNPQYPLDVVGTLHATSLSIPSGTFGALTLDGATNSIYNSNPGSPSLTFGTNAISTAGTINAGNIQTAVFRTDSAKTANISPLDSALTFGNPSVLLNLHSPNSSLPAIWNYSFGVSINGSKANPCASSVSIGTSVGNSALTISSCSSLNQLTVVNPSSQQVVANIDNAGNATLSGKVVIGSSSLNLTTPGNYGLYVAGGLLTEGVKIALHNDAINWSDYVFAKDYKLKSLKEVEQFIVEHQHLPDVPSANEIQKNGINVADMDATLLKKIEELTLYIIQQQLHADRQDEEIKAMKVKIDQLTKNKK